MTLIPKTNPARSRKYRLFISEQPCVVCGATDVQAAHTSSLGRGIKGSDMECIPLCLRHHAEFDGAKLPSGNVGRAAFIREYGLNVEAEIRRLNMEFETGVRL